MTTAQPFAGAARFRFPSDGKRAYEVYRLGEDGPPVILLHELDGLGHSCQALAVHLSKRFTVYTPTLYGGLAPGDNMSSLRRKLHVLGGVGKLCIRQEIHLFAMAKRSRFTDWVRALAEKLEGEHGRRVGLIGMCMTGGTVLAALPHPAVGAGVSAQLALPWVKNMRVKRERRASIGLGDEDLQKICGDPTPLKVFRFTHDPACPDERVETIESCFPQAKPVYSIDEPTGMEGKLHPTLTAHWRIEDDYTDRVRELSLGAVEEASDFLLANL